MFSLTSFVQRTVPEEQQIYVQWVLAFGLEDRCTVCSGSSPSGLKIAVGA